MTKKTTNKILVLENRLLYPLFLWLETIPLVGRESRERSRFNIVIGERVNENEKIRKEMIIKYCKLDKDKKPLTETKKVVDPKNPNGEKIDKTNYVFKNNKEEKAFMEELGEYMKEKFIIDVLEGNKAKVYTTRDIILNSQEKFSGAMAVIYEEWCTAFEKLPPRQEISK